MGSADQRQSPQWNAPNQGSAENQNSGKSVSNVPNALFSNPTLVGDSDAFSSLLDMIRAIAVRKCSVMISGETGTGKEMVARKIHYHSQRAHRPFVPVDCSTLTGTLFESQLFGHTKGAFTGAISDTLGFFRAADSGTIFLDEIGEIPLELQAKLLRVLQESRITPVGSTQSHPIDVRVICATNRDLKKMVEKDEFRADLFYRINVVNLEIPPLRQRGEDILPLAHYFLKNLADFYEEPAKTLTPKARDLLLKYHWPGNVREMANAMERAYVLSETEQIAPDVLPREILTAAFIATPDGPLPSLDDAQSKLVAEALRLAGGKKVAAARILGIDRRRLNRLIEKLNIQVPKSGK